MALTQAQAITDVRARIDEEDINTGFVKDSQIRSWINEGVREVARKSFWKKTSGTVSVTAGTQYYTAPLAAIQIYRVEYTATGASQIYPLEFVTLNAMDTVWGTGQSQGRSTPETYSIVGSNPPSIQLFPTPGVNGSLKVYYYAMPADLATADTSDASDALDVPNGWEDLVVDYATAQAFRKARDLQSFQVTMAQFDRNLNRLLETAVQYTDEPTYITPEWGGYDW